MKLITAIVNKDDGRAVQSGLTSKGFTVTRIATTGGFLMAGNVTFILGVEDDKVDEAIDIIALFAEKRKQIVPPTASYGMGVSSAYPIELMMGGATVFVQDVERFEKM